MPNAGSIMTKPSITIGWKEYIDLPDWNIEGVRAKIDTGARTSALHVEDVEILAKGKVKFHVILSRRKKQRVSVVTDILRIGKVRSSIGCHTERIFVSSRVRMGPVVKRIEINLVDRKEMRFRMLLGRTAIDKHALIDVNSSYLLGKRKKKKPGKPS